MNFSANLTLKAGVAMKKKRFSAEQTVGVLQQVESGIPVADH